MKAVIHSKYGSPENLKIKEIAKPTPKENELLIKVYATTVNRTDCAMLVAKPFIMRFMTGFFKPKNPILGTDFAGIVEQIGSNVINFNIGDKVFGFNDMGLSSHAEYVAITEDNFISTIPSGISFETAAASIEGAHYAQNFINKVRIHPNSKILVNGATGAIGSALVQLLAARNIEVTATANTKNIQLIKNLGVSKVIDYTKEDFTKINQQYDFVFDAVGKSIFGKCKNILKPNGIYISSELGPWAQNLWYALVTPIFNQKKVIFPYPNKHMESIALVKTLMAQHKFKPLIDKTFQIHDASNAFTYVASEKKIGNVILQIAE